MLDSTLVNLIANDPLLRLRVEALLRQRMVQHEITVTERAVLSMGMSTVVENVLWQIAGNPTIFGAIRNYLDANAGVSAAQSIEAAANDGDISYVLFSQVTALA